MLNVNPFFVLEDDPTPDVGGTQVGRAASLMWSSLKFVSALRNQTLPPDAWRGKPLCMAQVRALAAVCVCLLRLLRLLHSHIALLVALR